MNHSLHLGIDIGTSKIAVLIADSSGTPVQHLSSPHAADVDTGPNRSEQDAQKIFTTVNVLLKSLAEEDRSRIRSIGITGQMHGVVQHDLDGEPRSNLVTWQDSRNNGLTVQGRAIPAGYGYATLDHWTRSGQINGPRVSTIHGLLAARLCRLQRAPIDPTDLHAWGGPVTPDGIAADLLPERVGHGTVVGWTHSHPHLPDGIPVAAPLGDNQASFRATVDAPATQAAFTIGTGCQISRRIPRELPIELPKGCQRRPFDADHELLVGAPRNGGSVWKWFAERTQSWLYDLSGNRLSLDNVFARLDALGMDADECLTFDPLLSSESNAEANTASLKGFSLANGSIGEIARAVAYGIVSNASRTIPPDALQGCTEIVCSGNALRHSRLLRHATKEVFGLPLKQSDFPEEAALGAAKVGIAALGI